MESSLPLKCFNNKCVSTPKTVYFYSLHNIHKEGLQGVMKLSPGNLAAFFMWRSSSRKISHFGWSCLVLQNWVKSRMFLFRNFKLRMQHLNWSWMKIYWTNCVSLLAILRIMLLETFFWQLQCWETKYCRSLRILIFLGN